MPKGCNRRQRKYRAFRGEILIFVEAARIFRKSDGGLRRMERMKAGFLLMGLMLVVALASGLAAAQASSPGAEEAGAVRALAGLPLLFEQNNGQAPSRARYFARSGRATVFLKNDGIEIASAHSLVSVRYANAHPKDIIGMEAVSGKSHYLVGSDSKKWITDVPNYGQVAYRRLYPGIDLLFYGNNRIAENDFVVAPHADAKKIQLELSGSAHVAVSPMGELQMSTADGVLSFGKPVAYQWKDDKKETVDATYALSGNRVTFKLGKYDGSRQLIIDPTLSYASYIGGSSYDTANAVVADGTGNVFVAGETSSLDFPATAGTIGQGYGNGGSTQGYVAKINADGSLGFATYFGGADGDDVKDIGLTSAGEIVLTGGTSSQDFPVTGNAFQLSNNSTTPSHYAGYLLKLNSTGSSILYASYFGGSSNDGSHALAVDPSDMIYITGTANSEDLPVKNALYASRNGISDAFVAAFNTGLSGNSSLVYATYIGGGGTDDAVAIAVNAAGSVVIAGSTQSLHFPTTGNAISATNACAPPHPGDQHDAFVTRFAAGGTSLVYSTMLGGCGTVTAGDIATGNDQAKGVAIDAAGNIFVAGNTSSKDIPADPTPFPTTGSAYQHYADCSSDQGPGFVAKIDGTSGALLYSSYFCFAGLGSSFSNVHAMAVDQGKVFIGGQRMISGDSLNLDGFVAKFDPSQIGAASFVYSTVLSGSADEQINDIAVSNGGTVSVIVVGNTASSDFPVSNDGWITVAPAGLGNAFYDDFGSGDDAWTTKGTWQVVDDTLRGDGTATKATASADTDAADADSIDVDVLTEADAGNLEVYGWYVGGGDYVKIILKEATNKCRLLIKSGGVTLFSQKVPFVINANTTYHVHLDSSGGGIVLSINGSVVSSANFPATDGSNIRLVAKSVSARFDNVGAVKSGYANGFLAEVDEP